MDESSTKLSLDEAGQTMSLLAGRLEEFVTAWESSDEPPAVARFLPQAGGIRNLLLVELIKVDLEYRWLIRNCPKRIDEYLTEFPELADGSIPPDLIYEEFHIRRQSGSPPVAQEYLDRFPDQASELRCLLELGEPYQSTAVYSQANRPNLDTLGVDERIDDFVLLAELGRGAFARVFLARQESMQRLVALKISADQGDEPQTLAQLDHDFIVRVYDQRVLADRRLRLLYMQYVAGGTLQMIVHAVRSVPASQRSGQLLIDAIDRWLEQRGEMRPVESTGRKKLASRSWPEAVGWLGARMALALAYAHRRGVLHRDVKPANVLLTPEGTPKLADFNISFSSKLSGATPAAYFGGSLAYMSPEQLEACHPGHERQPDSLDGRSDVYSLGVVLWELMTGCRPFVEENVEGGWSQTVQAMARRRRAGVDPSALASLGDTCPPAFRRILRTCLAPEAEARWQSAGELSKQLELCTRPDAQRLLAPPEESWRVRLLPYSLVILFLAAAVPNGIAGYLNYAYNRKHIIDTLAETAQPVFMQIVLVINAVAYPIGLGAFLYLCGTIMRAVRADGTGRGSGSSSKRTGEQKELDETPEKPTARAEQNLSTIRHRCLRLGHIGALIAVSLWVVAGVTYPTTIRLLGVELQLEGYFHFFGSLFLCGLIAAAYPFFAVSLYSVRVLYSALLRKGLAAVDDRRRLEQLGQLLWIYALLAALVPLCGVAAMVFVNPTARSELIVLSTGGILGLPAVFWFFRLLQADLSVLKEVMTPD